MRISHLCSIARSMAMILVLCPGAAAIAQSGDQAIKTLPQQLKDNGENHVVAKTNSISNNTMNKLDSAGNKVFKGLSGVFKKKKKPPVDSTAVPRIDTSASPKSSSIIRNPGIPAEFLAVYTHCYFLNVHKENYQS